ncbi:sigma-70 family RNA polymerase sigma factor [Marinimicrobium sp. ABcell2]|uniref:sigma-70 family RNA polymerase sigma factor n=1 Tax=Marinimicrobium sp. ABcell2 TaxID=3069751 RepID=UPI0027B1F01B|nr:sigma-70 family RNA polymerase sigma factor [Marinimicrobium sp. ABcell2]MDQ2076803.1 sigma-70 family RNA polymerase sigma factor [Marinimicrobium sp. ABcell2]
MAIAPGSTNIVASTTMREDEWSQLLARLATAGDEGVFARLFRHFAPLVKGFYLSNGGLTPESADELVQEVMVKVWRKAAGFDPRKSSASTWIFTIARNSRIDYLRKHASNEAATSTLESEDIWSEGTDNPPFVYLQQSLDQRDIDILLSELPQEQRECLFKVYLEGKSHADLAEELNLPLGTVKSRIRLGLSRLKSAVNL